MIKAIDLSHHNGEIDFKKVRDSGIDTVFLRTGFGFYSQKQIDKRFYENYDKARAEGFRVGAYHYSYALSPADAAREAEAMVKIIGNRKFDLPLFFDIEESKQAKCSKAVCSDMVRAFCDNIRSCGFDTGVYSYDAFFGSNIEDDIYLKYHIWVARVEDVMPKQCRRYDIWQYSWKGAVDGIKGDVDMNRIFSIGA